MDLQQLKYFKAVATLGKISEAAESLFISAPALSTSISRLEKELGVRLFDRSGNRITLNAQGTIFLKYANQILLNLENARQELRESMVQQSPCISIAGTNSSTWVSLISAFTSEFPDYTMSCSSTSKQTLEENGFSTHHDFLLAYEHEIPPHIASELDSLFLFHSKPVVVLHKDHPLANQTAIDIPMLKNEKLLMPYLGNTLSSRLMQLFELHGLPYPGDNCYPFLARQKMVSENIGVSFTSQVNSLIFAPNVCNVPLVDPFEPWAAHLYWRKNHSLTERDESFLSFAKTFYQDLH